MSDRDLTCPHCGNAEMVEWEWQEVDVAYEDKKVPTLIPVQTCTLCSESWTDHIAALIQDGAVLPLREEKYQERIATLEAQVSAIQERYLHIGEIVEQGTFLSVIKSRHPLVEIDALMRGTKVYIDTAPTEQCQHEWVSTHNPPMIQGGELCTKCNAIRAAAPPEQS